MTAPFVQFHCYSSANGATHPARRRQREMGHSNIFGLAVAAATVSALLARAPLGSQRPAAPPAPLPVLREPAAGFDCVDGPGRSVRCARLPASPGPAAH